MNHRVIRYEADETSLYTVIYKDHHGEHDMSAQNPCESIADLLDFIGELHVEGFITAAERDSLLSDCEVLVQS